MDWRKVRVVPLDQLESWMTLDDFEYPMADGSAVFIKAGFKTDLASIPRCLWNLYPPYDPRYRASAILHDGIYAAEIFPRSQCDWLLLCAMQSQGNSWLKRNIFYCAVRAGGEAAWAKHTDATRAEAAQYVRAIP